MKTTIIKTLQRSHATALAYLLLFPSMATPCQALNRNAAYGVGMGLGLVAAAIASQQRVQPPYAHVLVAYRRQRFSKIILRPTFLRRRVGAINTNTLNVSANTPIDSRVYWNCHTPYGMRDIIAKAQHGFMRESYSTRFICKNPNQPVKVFTYISPADYVGNDEISYVERGHVIFTDKIAVGDFKMPEPINTVVHVNSGEDRQLIGFDSCNHINTQANGRTGFTAVHEDRSPDSRCKNGVRYFQWIIYHSASDFHGVDQVDMVSSDREPLHFEVHVDNAVADTNLSDAQAGSKQVENLAAPQAPIIMNNSATSEEKRSASIQAEEKSIESADAGISNDHSNAKGSPAMTSPIHPSLQEALGGAPRFGATMTFERPTPKAKIYGGTETARWMNKVGAMLEAKVDQLPRTVHFPTAALVAKVAICFHVGPEGRVTLQEYCLKSGYTDIDALAMRALRASQPFPPPPPGLERGLIWVKTFDGKTPDLHFK